MELKLYKDIGSENLDKSLASVAELIKIYYVYYGRNAWNATWVTQYTNGCMHTSLESAKSFAERGRNQGNVFYINELPALLIKSNKGFLIVTEMNSQYPLDSYSHTYDVYESYYEYGPCETILTCAKNVKLNVIEDSFRPFSDNGENYKSRNSVITLGLERMGVLFEKFYKNKSQRYTSYSMGGDYRLGWSQNKLDRNPVYIKSIIRLFEIYSLKYVPLYNKVISWVSRYKFDYLANSQKLLSISDEIFDEIKSRSYPLKKNIEVLVHENIFDDTVLNDMNRISKKVKMNYIFNVEEVPRKDKVLFTLKYPINFWEKLMETRFNEDVFESLKLLLIRTKLKMDDRRRKNYSICLKFSDGYFKERIFYFHGRSDKVDWLRALNMLYLKIPVFFDSEYPDHFGAIYEENGYWVYKS